MPWGLTLGGILLFMILWAVMTAINQAGVPSYPKGRII